MSTISINGKTYSGKSVVVINNRVMIDGIDLTPNTTEISISVEGDIKELRVDHCDSVNVKGNVEKLSTASGDVNIEGNVGGNVSTASGDVDCGDVGGNISTASGDIKHRKAK